MASPLPDAIYVAYKHVSGEPGTTRVSSEYENWEEGGGAKCIPTAFSVPSNQPLVDDSTIFFCIRRHCPPYCQAASDPKGNSTPQWTSGGFCAMTRFVAALPGMHIKRSLYSHTNQCCFLSRYACSPDGVRCAKNSASHLLKWPPPRTWTPCAREHRNAICAATIKDVFQDTQLSLEPRFCPCRGRPEAMCSGVGRCKGRTSGAGGPARQHEISIACDFRSRAGRYWAKKREAIAGRGDPRVDTDSPSTGSCSNSGPSAA